MTRRSTTNARRLLQGMQWRRLLSLAAALVLLAASSARPLAAGGAVIGFTLQQRLAAAAATDALQVIVTFEGRGAPTASQLAALAGLGVAGIHLRSFPIAGVVATPAQIERIA